MSESCYWTLADMDASHYETSCGHAFEFNEAGPVENGLKFCGYCGKPLEVIEPEQQEAGR